jgi:hypothetical protein
VFPRASDVIRIQVLVSLLGVGAGERVVNVLGPEGIEIFFNTLKEKYIRGDDILRGQILPVRLKGGVSRVKCRCLELLVLMVGWRF